MAGRGKGLWVAVVVAAGLAVYSVADAQGFRRYFRLQRELASMTERNQRTVDENRALLREIEGLRTDPKALERAAREELGFVKPGEVVINLE